MGNFFRAHQAFYTDLAPDSDRWGIVAFTGRSTHLADVLTAQGGLYTLIVRGPAGDAGRIVGSVSEAHPGADQAAWLRYPVGPAGGDLDPDRHRGRLPSRRRRNLDLTHPAVQQDLRALRADPDAAVSTVPHFVAGLAARRRADAGPLAVVSCDNLTDNGAVTARIVTDFAAALDADLARWIGDTIAFVTTMVDRITQPVPPTTRKPPSN